MERPFRVNEHLRIEIFNLFNHSNFAASAARTATGYAETGAGSLWRDSPISCPLIDPVCAQGNDLIFPDSSQC
jgi:hypothetical protein